MKLRNTILYLIGVPAVGKYTTAKEIDRAAGVKVVDDHLVNNPIFTLLERENEHRLKVPKEAWQHIKQSIES